MNYDKPLYGLSYNEYYNKRVGAKGMGNRQNKNSEAVEPQKTYTLIGAD